MTSPYIDPRAQKYDPGNRNDNHGQGVVNWVTGIGFSSSSDSTMRILPIKATPVSGFGKPVVDNRMHYNRGFRKTF